MDTLWDSELWSLLDALDGVMEAERLARRSLEWDAAMLRPKLALHTARDVHADLWARHRPHKNRYAVRDGRRVLLAHTFVRRNVPAESDEWCHYCMCDGVTCRVHEFELYGKDGVRRYVDNARYYDLWE